MQTIFITGASSGIGLATAEYFAQRNWRVIATMRNTQKAGKLAQLENVVVMPLDVTDMGQIKSTCQEAIEKYDVDVILNNAGYGAMAALERLDEQTIRDVFEADVFGTIFVAQQFIPHFKHRRSGSILTTTSLAAIIALPRDAVYGAAKRAQQAMLESLYYEMKPFNVAVKAIIPGGTKTNFQTPIWDVTDYEQASANQRKYLLDGNDEFPGPEEAAETVWRAVHDGKDQINYPSDSVCQKLYDQYQAMGLEQFKVWFSDVLYKPSR